MCSRLWAIAAIGFLLLLGCATRATDRVRPVPPDNTPDLINERGALTYVARTYDARGVSGGPSRVQGLILLRDRSELAPLGGPYFGDGFGNLIRRGTFNARAYGGRAEYALTFPRRGGMQIALDFRRDSVVDAVVDISPDSSYGIFADAELQRLLDCFVAGVTAGQNPVEVMNACLGVAGGEGGGGGLGAAPARDYDRLAEPDCEPSGGLGEGVPESVSGPTWERTRTRNFHDEESGESFFMTERSTQEGAMSREVRVYDHSGNLVFEMSVYFNEHGERRYMSTTTWTHHDGVSTAETTIVENGTGRSFTTTMGTTTTRREGEPEEGAESGEGEGEEGAEPAETGTTGQPGAGCELEGTCPVADPRCGPPQNDADSLWNCVARTGLTPLECLERIQDAIFAATGCRRAVGPAGQTVPECPPSPSETFSDCIAGGGNVEECLRGAITDAGGGEIEPGMINDDVFGRFRNAGSSGITYLDTTPLGAILVTLCAEVDQCPFGPGIF